MVLQDGKDNVENSRLWTDKDVGMMPYTGAAGSDKSSPGQKKQVIIMYPN